jgi:hypothetical protein
MEHQNDRRRGRTENNQKNAQYEKGSTLDMQ